MKELQEMSDKELQKLLIEKQEQLLDMRMKARADQLKQVRHIRQARKDVARIHTLLNQRHKS